MSRLIKIGAILCGTFLLVSGGDSKTMAVEKVNGFSLSKSSITIKEGKSIEIKTSDKSDVKVNFSSDTISKKFSLSADKKNVVLVIKKSDYYYKVKGRKPGKVKLTIKNVENPSLSKDLMVTVKKKGKKVAKRGAGVKTLTFKDFEKAVVKAKGRVAIMFGTEWCHYCQLLDPIYKKVAEKDANVKYYRVDAEKEEELSALFGITAYPYVYLLENDKTIDVAGYYKDWTVDDYIKWANEKKVQR